LSEYIYAEGETSLAEKVVQLLIEKDVKIALAESCTGGLLAAAITDIPGASKVFMEGAVTYSNTAKISRLGVKAETIGQYGEVSEQTAAEMVQGLMAVENVSMGLSITGIAGPGGATDTKPVGLVYIGMHYKGETKVKKLNFSGNRKNIRVRTVMTALDFIRKELLHK
jgi:nicotinamide-nucleotide amidase